MIPDGADQGSGGIRPVGGENLSEPAGRHHAMVFGDRDDFAAGFREPARAQLEDVGAGSPNPPDRRPGLAFERRAVSVQEEELEGISARLSPQRFVGQFCAGPRVDRREKDA